MTEAFLSIVATYGVFAIAVSSFLSCLLVPIPTALVMLAGGAFAAAEDLVLAQVLAFAWLGAVLGDQTGFHIGRRFGPLALDRLAERPKPKAAMERARAMVDKYGGLSVFFSTWAVAPLGPYVNIAAGAGGLSRWRFTLWDAAGEAIWVAFYVLMGFAFASEITSLSEILGNASGFVAAGVLTLILGIILVHRLRNTEHKD